MLSRPPHTNTGWFLANELVRWKRRGVVTLEGRGTPHCYYQVLPLPQNLNSLPETSQCLYAGARRSQPLHVAGTVQVKLGRGIIHEGNCTSQLVLVMGNKMDRNTGFQKAICNIFPKSIIVVLGNWANPVLTCGRDWIYDFLQVKVFKFCSVILALYYNFV